MSVLVSVIIPVFNSAPYLDACLRSVLKQNYKELEIVIINDGSTDNSLEIIEEFIKIDNRIKVLNQENHGLGYTRNRGILESHGRYLFFLDSDDILPENSIQTLVNATLMYDADYSVGKVLRFNSERRYVPIRHSEFQLYDQNEATSLLRKTELLQDSIACNKLWKKDFIIENKLFFTEGKYYEDLKMTLQAAVLAKKIVVTNKTVYLWRVRDDEGSPSITQQQMKLGNTQDRISALIENRKWLVSNDVPEQIIAEHDRKALLDILRLHVPKFTLIDDNEKDEWIRTILTFLEQIPDNVSQMLPIKEKKLYDLLKRHQFSDLELFSQMYTNTETSPIVNQEGLHFFLKGSQNTLYDVTNDLKPTMIVTNIETQTVGWKLVGEVKIPKASIPTNGHFYAMCRENKHIIKLVQIEFEGNTRNTVYRYENQQFKIIVPQDAFANVKGDSIYDFFFRLSWDDQHRPARVRFKDNPSSLSTKKRSFSFYRTNNGNLSLKSKKVGLNQRISNLIKSFTQ